MANETTWAGLRVALPALTPEAQALIQEFVAQGRDRVSGPRARTNESPHVRVLRVLFSWLGALAPILQYDVRAVAAQTGAGYRRELVFLAEHDLLKAGDDLMPRPPVPTHRARYSRVCVHDRSSAQWHEQAITASCAPFTSTS